MSGAIYRMLTCGSVDDGKSTLIGRLLVETDSVPHDTVEAAKNTRRAGSVIAAGEIDFSLFTDGLEAEREQGITIDVAYRSMSLPSGKRLIISDSPGHIEYTRNMCVAASRADIALVLVDSTKGVREQTLRHLTICTLMGVSRVIVAINKLDAFDFDQKIFSNIVSDLNPRVSQLEIRDIHYVPISALHGDNVCSISSQSSWYTGSTILDLIESWEKTQTENNSAKMLIQSISRAEDFRGLAGTIEEGTFSQGQQVTILPSGKVAQISRIVTFDGELATASSGRAVNLELSEDLDASRGDIVIAENISSDRGDNFLGRVIWFSESPLQKGHSYLFSNGPRQFSGVIKSIKSKLDFTTGSQVDADEVVMNDVATAEILLDSAHSLFTFRQSHQVGHAIIIDRATAETVGAIMINKVLKHSSNVVTQNYDIDHAMRASQMKQRPQVLWFTGLSGSGKSTIANSLEKTLFLQGKHVYVLDGDNVRHGISSDLGFSREDRVENIRRISEVSKLMWDAGLIVIVALISPYRADRDLAKELFPEGDFLEIYVNTPPEICYQRDNKGLYSKAATGEISNFTGISQAYEPPLSADIVVDGSQDVATNVNQILRAIF